MTFQNVLCFWYVFFWRCFGQSPLVYHLVFVTSRIFTKSAKKVVCCIALRSYLTFEITYHLSLLSAFPILNCYYFVRNYCLLFLRRGYSSTAQVEAEMRNFNSAGAAKKPRLELSKAERKADALTKERFAVDLNRGCRG